MITLNAIAIMVVIGVTRSCEIIASDSKEMICSTG